MSSNLLSGLFQIYCNNLNKKESVLLGSLLFISLYQELSHKFEYFNTNEKEERMISGFLIQGLVNDLLGTKDYTLAGLASYTGYPEEVIYDIAVGLNINPTLALATKIMELHSIARRDCYHELIEKIMKRFSSH